MQEYEFTFIMRDGRRYQAILPTASMDEHLRNTRDSGKEFLMIPGNKFHRFFYLRIDDIIAIEQSDPLPKSEGSDE